MWFPAFTHSTIWNCSMKIGWLKRPIFIQWFHMHSLCECVKKDNRHWIHLGRSVPLLVSIMIIHTHGSSVRVAGFTKGEFLGVHLEQRVWSGGLHFVMMENIAPQTMQKLQVKRYREIEKGHPGIPLNKD